MVTVGMAMEATITVKATTTVIMAMDIGTTGTMATDMATVGGGMGAGMVMGSEPAGPGRHMATSGFATSCTSHEDVRLGPPVSFASMKGQPILATQRQLACSLLRATEKWFILGGE
jgi:hypothetical protein